jgi:hypothetical protein
MARVQSRRRRRRPSRSTSAVVFGAVAAAIVAFLLIGGIVRSGSQSAGYLRDLNRSYADQVDVLAARSDVLGSRLGSLLPAMSGETRPALEATLDTLVRAADDLSRAASTLQSPAPSGGAGAGVAAAFADRAEAASELRRTVDGLLGMSPLPVVASVDPPSSITAPPPPLSAAAGARALERVGSLVVEANRDYAAARRTLRAAPGHAVLGRSAWSKGAAAWTATGAQSVVTALLASPTLAAVHQVVLVAHALALTPAPVPPGPSAAATSGVVVPPTRRMSVSAVVANDGNVPERHVVVSEQLSPAAGDPTGATVRHAVAVSLAAGSSDSVSMPPFTVVPGGRYTLTVTVVPPVADGPAAVTSDTVPFTVGPPSPPTVAQIAPSKGRARGGTRVTILGSGFSLATSVEFGTVDAHFKVISDTEIIAVSPAGTGTVTVTVVDSGGPSGYSPGGRFAYKEPRGTTTTTGPTSPASTTTTTTT